MWNYNIRPYRPSQIQSARFPARQHREAFRFSRLSPFAVITSRPFSAILSSRTQPRLLRMSVRDLLSAFRCHHEPLLRGICCSSAVITSRSCEGSAFPSVAITRPAGRGICCSPRRLLRILARSRAPSCHTQAKIQTDRPPNHAPAPPAQFEFSCSCRKKPKFKLTHFRCRHPPHPPPTLC